MLVEYVIESQEGGLLESVLMPFDIYNDAADQALRTLKQRFLYDEIEAEVFTQDTFSRKNILQIPWWYDVIWVKQMHCIPFLLILVPASHGEAYISV